MLAQVECLKAEMISSKEYESKSDFKLALILRSPSKAIKKSAKEKELHLQHRY